MSKPETVARMAWNYRMHCERISIDMATVGADPAPRPTDAGYITDTLAFYRLAERLVDAAERKHRGIPPRDTEAACGVAEEDDGG